MLKLVLLLTFIFNFGWAYENLEEGVALYKNKRYEEALVVFEQKELIENQQLGSLVGQLFCNVALGHFNRIDPLLQQVSVKVQEFTDCDTPPQSEPVTQEQQHQSYLCRRRVREVANHMRETVEKLVRESVPGVFQKIKVLRQLYPFIDNLEQIAIECCQNNYPWSCCLNPLLEQLEAWNSLGLEISS